MKRIRSVGSRSSNSSVPKFTETYLTDDLWHEIFLCLPLYPIFKFRCVSKVWLSILSNPNFLTKWNKRNKLNSSLWILIHGSSVAKEKPPGRHNSSAKRSFTLSCPELNSQFISHHQSLSGFSLRFVNKKHELSTTNLYIIGSSNGLVLCTTDYFKQKTCYVCNPLTKQWVSLPPPPRKRFMVQTGFTCDECCYSSSLISTSFKVIRVYQKKDSFKIDIFTSDLGEWNVYDVLYPPGVYNGRSIYDNYVTCNGVFYWYQKVHNNVLAFSVDSISNHQTCGNECRLIKLPDRQIYDETGYVMQSTRRKQTYLHQCLGESEGLICFAIIKQTERSLSLWVLEENWYLMHKDIEFCDMLTQMKSVFVVVESKVDLIKEIQVLGFNPVDKNVVILGYKKHILAYNIRNGGCEQLSPPSFLDSKLSGPRFGELTFFLKPRPTILPPVSW